jgi:opacity protein-like surface antigen
VESAKRELPNIKLKGVTMKRLLPFFFLITVLSTAALAQDSTASQQPASNDSGYGHGDYGTRADVFVTGFGLLPSQSNGNSIGAKGTKAAGVSAGYRFYLNASSALEGRYSFSRNSQKYTIGSSVSSIPVYLSEISGSYIYNFAKSHRIRPFLEGGGGLVLFSPGNYGAGTTASGAVIPTNVGYPVVVSQSSLADDNSSVTSGDPVYGGSSASLGRQAKAMFLYGAGADFPALSHLYFRVEFRSLGYKTPDFSLAPLQTNAFSFVYEPSVGVAFRF